MDQHCGYLLNQLHTMKPGGTNKVPSSFEAKITKITWWFRGVSLFIFLVLGVIAIAIHYAGAPNVRWFSIVEWTGLGAMALALLGIVSVGFVAAVRGVD
ncbi:MAG: hypothetical protein JWQ10_4009 [Herbaspirillum sp.]|nr:hypothetical protein [Herbaspirillum sp.]